MRITVVTGPFLSVPPAPCGAVERAWDDLSREFARAGHQVTIICRDHPDLPLETVRRGVCYRAIQPFNSTRWMPLNLLKDALYGLRVAMVLDRSDVIVTNSFFLPVILGWLRPSSGKINVHVARMPKGQIRYYLGAGVARFSALSTSVKEAIARECPAAESCVRVIPDPIRTEVFTPPQPPRSFDGERVILYTGRVHPEKGLDLLIDAFRTLASEFPSVRLRLIGPWRFTDGGGGGGFRAQLLASSSGLPVEMLDPIYDRHKLAEALRAAHYYCYPSLAERGETFGVAPLEAMGTGLATVVSDLGCFRDFVSDGENGLIFNHRSADPARELAKQLRRLLVDENLARRLGDAAAATASTYTNERVASMYMEDFNALMSER